MERTHYDVLEVSPKASPEAIKGAYRFLQQKWHPDRNPDAKARAEQVTRELNQAYEVLSDPSRRADYDALLRARNAAAGAPPRPGSHAEAARRIAAAARAYRNVQAAGSAPIRPRRTKQALSTLATVALAAAIVALLFAANPGLLRRGMTSASTLQPTAADDAGAEYRRELARLRYLHPELDPTSSRYDVYRAQGFRARVGQYVDRGLPPAAALRAAARDTYSP